MQSSHGPAFDLELCCLFLLEDCLNVEKCSKALFQYISSISSLRVTRKHQVFLTHLQFSYSDLNMYMTVYFQKMRQKIVFWINIYMFIRVCSVLIYVDDYAL